MGKALLILWLAEIYDLNPERKPDKRCEFCRFEKEHTTGEHLGSIVSAGFDPLVRPKRSARKRNKAPRGQLSFREDQYRMVVTLVVRPDKPIV